MKKVIINIIFVLIFFITYFLQCNFFNWFTISGVMPNLFVILIIWIGLFGNKFMGVTYGIIIGFFLDYIFKSKVGITAITLGLVGLIAKIFDKNFSKDSRITIMLIVGVLTAFYEIVSYFANYIVFSTQIEIMSFVKILVIEVIYNVILTVILYPIIQKFGYYVENEYKGNQILTRYFM